MVMEYDKYLVILAREAILRLGPGSGQKAAQTTGVPSGSGGA
jgi:hypothetical protein